MIRRRAKAAEVKRNRQSHSPRDPAYLQNAGSLEIAQQMANHRSAGVTGSTPGAAMMSAVVKSRGSGFELQ
ncbi:MAG TPA: hypothetical protein VEX68_30450 [Bryobacteraceae bacterium]|nr:hypothetical protein [Bryobacteraceae bacterium]